MTPINGLKRIARERSKDSLKDFWRYHKRFIAWVAMALVVGISQIQLFVLSEQNQDAISAVQEERTSRVSAINSVNVFFCQENNHQDRLIGKLLAISLQNAPDPSKLTEKQQKQLRKFKEVEDELNDTTNCQKLAEELAKALGINPNDVHISPLPSVTLPDSIPSAKNKKDGDKAVGRGSGETAPSGGGSTGDSGGETGSGGSTGTPGSSGHAGVGGGSTHGTHHPKHHAPHSPTAAPPAPAPAPAPTADAGPGNGNGKSNGEGNGTGGGKHPVNEAAGQAAETATGAANGAGSVVQETVGGTGEAACKLLNCPGKP